MRRQKPSHRQNDSSAGEDSLFDPFVAEKESFRPAKVANRIKEELLLLVPESLKDPRMKKVGAMTVTSVVCTPDLRNARVMFALYENESQYKLAETILNNAAGFLRREVSDRLGIKYTPILSFHFDKGMAHSKRIHDLLKGDKGE